MNNRVVITIGREYGSGGRQIGKLIAQKLDIPFYDKELLNRAEEESGLDAEVFNTMDEKRCTNLIYSVLRRLENRGHGKGGAQNSDFITMNDRLFLIQKQVLRTIASEGSCVIMGRCSNIALEKDEAAIHFFVKAKEEYKIALLKKIYDLDRKAALKLMRDTDKDREGYYTHYSGRKWGQAGDFDFVMDTSVLGYEATAEIMSYIALKKLNGQEPK